MSRHINYYKFYYINKCKQNNKNDGYGLPNMHIYIWSRGLLLMFAPPPPEVRDDQSPAREKIFPPFPEFEFGII